MALRQGWPEMAHTRADVYKFCQMLNPGTDTDIVDLTQILPRNVNADSCLFQIQNRTLADLLQHIPNLGESVFNMKIEQEKITNSHNPEKTLQISGSKMVYYESASINRGQCQCIFAFGGEKNPERVQVTNAAFNSMAGLALEHWFVRNFLQAPRSWYKDDGCVSTVNDCHFLFLIVYCLFFCLLRIVYIYVYIYMLSYI